MAARIVTLAPGVHRIPTLGDFINSFAFVDPDGSVTLVDCGTSRASSHLVRALRALGKHPSDVQRILLTHAHSDHAGSAASMVAASSAEGVTVHEDDADAVRTGVAPQPGSTGGRLLTRLGTGRFPPVPTVGELKDADVVPVGGGLRVLHTPGHTPGHVSLLHEESGVLITGDALFNMRSRVTWPLAAFCTSAEQNARSAQRFVDLEFRIAAFTHGPEIRHGAREAIRTFLRRRRRGD